MYMAFSIIRKLVTPFEKMPAFYRGLIDDQGNFLRARKDFNVEDKKALGYIDVMVINLKKLIAKIPGGSTRIGTIAAALYLLRSDPKKRLKEEVDADELFALESEFMTLYEEVAVNSTQGLAGLPPDQPKISRAAANKYKKKNKALQLAMLRR